MRSFLSKLLILSLLTILALTTTGCKKKDPDALPYITPVEGWNDIALPPSAVWERSNISGKVENHFFTVPMGSAELFVFEEGVMKQNGWTLSKTVQDGRTFIKEGDQVEFSINNKTEEKTNFIIVIEPEDAYGNTN